MLAPLTDFSFGPYGHVFEVKGKILNEVPESARKTLPERESGRKIRSELDKLLQAVSEAGNTIICQRLGWH